MWTGVEVLAIGCLRCCLANVVDLGKSLRDSKGGSGGKNELQSCATDKSCQSSILDEIPNSDMGQLSPPNKASPANPLLKLTFTWRNVFDASVRPMNCRSDGVLNTS